MNSCNETNEKLIDYLSGDLPEGEAEALRSHCEQCSPCRDTLEAHQIILSTDASSPLADVPDHIANRILQASVQSVQPAKKPSPWRVISTLAALLLLCASLWMSFDGLKIESTDPSLEDVLQSAHELQSQGQDRRAIALLSARLAQNLDSSEPPILMHELAQSHRSAGELDRAFDLLTSLKTDFPSYPQRLPALLLLGDVIETMQRWDVAVDHYAWLAEEYPANRTIQELHSQSVAASHMRQLQAVGYLDALDAVGYVGD